MHMCDVCIKELDHPNKMIKKEVLLLHSLKSAIGFIVNIS